MDLKKIGEDWLNQCGPCDGGLPMGCACNPDDPRPVIAALVEQVAIAWEQGFADRDDWEPDHRARERATNPYLP